MQINKYKNILVTGGAGYIGSAITKKLCEKNYHVFVIDDLSKGEKKYVDKKAKFFKISLSQKKKLNDFFVQNQIDCVIHCAAKKAVGESEEKPGFYIEENITGCINLLNSMSQNNCNKIILSSTASVYKPNDEGICNEESEVESQNIYGFTKVVCENIIKEYARTTDLQYIFFRYFNVAGDIGLKYQETQAQNIFPVLSENIKNNTDFLVFGNDYDTIDGTGVRDYIHLDDLVSSHILGIHFHQNEIFNLGTKKGTSVIQIIDEFKKQLNRDIKFKFVTRRKGDLAKVIANSEKIKKILHWQPVNKFEKIVNDFIQTYDLH